MALLSPPTALADLRALLVGIDYQGADPHVSRLQGAVNDAEAVRGYLTSDLGLPAAAIHTLEESRATRSAILAEIKAWLLTAPPRDSVLFFFSGHGVAVPDPYANQSADPVNTTSRPTRPEPPGPLPERCCACSRPIPGAITATARSWPTPAPI